MNEEKTIKTFVNNYIDELNNYILLASTKKKTKKQQFVSKVRTETLIDCISIIAKIYDKNYPNGEKYGELYFTTDKNNEISYVFENEIINDDE